MPYIPHTEAEVRQMLDSINVNEINDLFDEIPDKLRCDKEQDNLAGIPSGLNEREVGRHIIERASQDQHMVCFAGAGAYDHFIPSAVWEITTRGEFYSAYTPYQAEASQGTLQLIYEFQTMIASLTGMDVANASLYDGGSALAEAILMAVRANKKAKSKKILIPDTVSPVYKQIAHTITHNQQIELQSIPYDPKSGIVDTRNLDAGDENFAALIIPMPNFFGQLEQVHQLTDWAHEHGALVIAVVNPMSLGVLEAPGNWGEKGADIAVGEGQSLGIPLASGGPYLGLMACKMAYVRQMPGRIIGRTEDFDGNPGFSLTLQAREQHIRRSKATSNICTNQGLLATAATIYMALMGSDGIYRNGLKSYENTKKLKQGLTQIDGIESIFSDNHFYEVLIKLPMDSDKFIEQMCERGILPGYNPSDLYPDLQNSLLIAATEKRNDQEIQAYIDAAREVIAKGT